MKIHLSAAQAHQHRGNIPALDGLRGLAILAVIAVHAFSERLLAGHALARSIAWVARAGWLGVDLFFVLSGFLITRLLVASRGSPGYFRRFWLFRCLRIFPLYYATLVAVLLLAPLVWPSLTSAYPCRHQSPLWLYWVNIDIVLKESALFRTHVFFLDHFWSLAVEEQFYLIWPFVVAITPPLHLRRVIVLAFISMMIASMASTLSPFQQHLLPHLRGYGLLAGAWLAAGPLPVWSTRRSSFVAVAAIGIGLLHVWLGSNLLHVWPDYRLLPMPVLRIPLVVISFTAVVFLSARFENRGLARVLSWLPLRLMGQYSYAVYVFHGFWLMPLERWLLGDGGTRAILVYSAALLAACYATGFVSYHVIEAPFLRLKERLKVRYRAAGSSPALSPIGGMKNAHLAT
jgi:peptidoglycan/LPS O-acetylase OafA/YrhL